MKSGKRSGLFICAGILTLALLSACGNNSSPIPLDATILDSHSAVLKNYSTLLTTGYNGFGQLGNGSLITQASLTVVPLRQVKKFALGADHTLAFTFSNLSSVYSWGSNYHGQLGVAAIATVGNTAYSPTPAKVTGFPGPVTDIAAGGFHSLAVSNGNVWSWGYNGYGQLGNGDITLADKNAPVKMADVNGSPLLVTNVAAGRAHSLALTPDGRVYGWGYNAYGQAGLDPLSANGTVENAAVPTVVASALSPLLGVQQIAAGGSTSYALKNDGTVWAWGYNGMGQLGTDWNVPANLFSSIAVQVQGFPAGAIITKISAGLDHALALLSDGTVWAWGFDQFGQLGDIGNSSNPLSNEFKPVQVLGPGTAKLNPPLTGVTDIMAFGNSSMALVNGKWYGWGDNGNGQLGNPIPATSIGYLTVPTLVGGF